MTITKNYPGFILFEDDGDTWLKFAEDGDRILVDSCMEPSLTKENVAAMIEWMTHIAAKPRKASHG